MSRSYLVSGILVLLVLGGLVACGGRSARERELMQADTATLSEDERAERARLLRAEERKRRAAASDIEGLTVGQYEDMPQAPPLPDFIDVDTSREELLLHAQMTALSEAQWILPPTINPEQRVIYLMHAWTPRFERRQERLANMLRDRELLNSRYMEMQSRETAWREEREQADRVWRKRMQDLRLSVPDQHDPDER
ncbi:MAG: hypothetical protein ACOCXJ_03325 [Planctomycetota bacterium]